VNGHVGPPTVVIDCFVESASRHPSAHLVVIDVIRATTVAVGAVATGRRCFLAASPAGALRLRARLGDALLAGEIAGDMPVEFDMNNSPADLDRRSDIQRPHIIVSSSGVPLMIAAGQIDPTAEIASFRNMTAVAAGLVARGESVALLGAGSRGEFREEDQLCAARIAEQLVTEGWAIEDEATREAIDRWRGAPVEAIATGASVAYLRRTDQLRDYDFVVSHVDDLELRCRIVEGEVVAGRAVWPIVPAAAS
jgi:2-phosphosulfolactate phosphatase